MILENNPFLVSGLADQAKGSARTVEDPRAVPNIRFQTRGSDPDAFENALADALMAVFGDGAEALDDVVAGLNARGSRDESGAAWTPESFTAQMATSAARLFAVS